MCVLESFSLEARPWTSTATSFLACIFHIEADILSCQTLPASSWQLARMYCIYQVKYLFMDSGKNSRRQVVCGIHPSQSLQILLTSSNLMWRSLKALPVV